MVEVGGCEITSVWYSARAGSRVVAKRNVLLRLPGGESEVFIDPRDYAPEVALADIHSRGPGRL